MKKIKSFFSRNRRRAVRLLISLSAVFVFVGGLFSVSASSVHTVSFNDCDYVSVVGFDGSEFVATSENPNGVTFTSGATFNRVFENVKSLYYECPIKISPALPENSLLNRNFYFRYFYFYQSSDYPTSYPMPSSFTLIITLISEDETITVFNSHLNSIDDLPDFVCNMSLKSSLNYKYGCKLIFDSPCGFTGFYPVPNKGSYEVFNSPLDFFIDNLRIAFNRFIKFLSSALAVIVASPALTVLCLAMPIVIFAVILLYRFKRT